MLTFSANANSHQEYPVQRVNLTLDVRELAPEEARSLAVNLDAAAENGEGITITTAGGTFTVDVARVQISQGLDLDSDAVDKIAVGLGTEPEWGGADSLEWIANVIGGVRPHPGDREPIEYVEDFHKATGVDPADVASGLTEYLSDDYREEVADKEREAATCAGCAEEFDSPADLDENKQCRVCALEATGESEWTFVGHWEDDAIVVEYVLPGAQQDQREDTGYWEQGLFAAAGTGKTQEEALQQVRDEYEAQYRA